MLNPGVRRVVQRKRILLIGKILRQLGFPNADLLATHLAKGFPVVGEVPITGSFPPCRTAPSCTTKPPTW